MQTSYEVVKRALHFEKPDRLPLKFSVFGHSDFADAGWNQIGTGDRTKRNTLDEWGCTWSRSEVNNMGLVTGNPLNDWANLKDFKFPNPNNPEFYEGMEKKFEDTSQNEKYFITGIFALLFERLHHLRGFENTLMDLYLERDKLEDLADKIVDYNIAIIENIHSKFKGKIHGFNFSDDWGTELNTFISVEMFDEFFKPRYKKIFDACNHAGWDIWMHSCGKINNFIPSLIEIGVTSLNLQQPRTNGIEELGRLYAGKVAFDTCCDIQKTLVSGTNEEIVEEAILLMNRWGTPKGGFIASSYGEEADIECIGSTLPKTKLMFDTFYNNDPWKAS